jgi:riboflavin transporter FmnP
MFRGFFMRKKTFFRGVQPTPGEETNMTNGLLQSIADNVIFVLVCVGVAVALFLIAYAVEKYVYKRDGITERILNTRKIAMIGLFSALAVILHVLDFPIPFAPTFYKLDFSEIPALLGAFAFGPVAGVMIEFCKVLLKLLLKGTSTAFVGDLANFVVGCSFILPASIIYLFKKTKKRAIASCVTGTAVMTIFGTAFNAVYLLPAFSKLYGMPLDAIIAMGQEINGSITGVVSFVCYCVAPMNLLKGFAASFVTMLVYKPLSPILKSAQLPHKKHVETKSSC